MTGGIRGIFEQKYQSADDVYSQFGYFGRGKGCVDGGSPFLKGVYLFWFGEALWGVSIITKYQEFEPNTDNLKVPRSTEKETWDFVMEECDRAIRLLPETRNNPSEEKRRATKWTAYALKSRAALHAASVAKYWDKAPLEGEAVDKNFVGLDKSDASRYYQACIDASKAIIASNRFGLYKAHPGSVQEAIANYRALFTDPNVAGEEAILSKAMELRVLGLHMIMMPGTIRIRMRKDSLTEVEPIQFLS